MAKQWPPQKLATVEIMTYFIHYFYPKRTVGVSKLPILVYVAIANT